MPEPALLMLLVAVPALIFGIRHSIRQARRRASAWQRAARQLGLSFQEGGITGGMAMSGFRGRVQVLVKEDNRGKQGTYTVFDLTGPDLSESLALRQEGVLRALFGGPDVRLADPAFDAAVRVTGDEAEIVALFDGALRATASELVQAGVRVEEGKLHFECKDLVTDFVRPLGPAGPSGVVDTTEALLRFVETLALRAGDVPARLARNAAREPQWSVRLRNLSLLQDRMADHDAALGASRAALSDSSPRVRLQAALGLGDERLDLVEAALLDPELEPAERRRSLAHLAAHLPRERGAPLLARVELLVLLEGASEAEAAAAGDALARLGGEAGEPALLALLEREEPATRVAAARALAGIGGVAAVEPLLALTRGLSLDGAVKREARAAIEAIQARLGERAPGSLSLAGGEGPAGGLSLDSPGAALSLAEAPGQEPPRRLPDRLPDQ